MQEPVRNVKPPIMFRVWLSTPDMGKNIGYHLMPENRIMDEIDYRYQEQWNMYAAVIKDKIFSAVKETLALSQSEILDYIEEMVQRDAPIPEDETVTVEDK